MGRRIKNIFKYLSLVLIIAGLMIAAGCGNPLLDTIAEMVEEYQASLTADGGPDPEINIKWNGVDISSGASCDLGMTDHGCDSTIYFLIENNGEGELILNGTPAVVLSGNAKYSVTVQPEAAIASGSSTTFTVLFSPDWDSGTEEVTVTISNNDPDEGTYTFTPTIEAEKYKGKKEIDTTGDVGEYSSIGVYQANVYISYYDVFNKDLKLAVSPDGGFNWTTSVVDSGGDVGQYCSLCVVVNKLYISYYDADNTNLKLAQSLDGGQNWSIETVDGSTDAVGQYSSIDVSESDEIFISYYDQIQEALKLAKYYFSGAVWEWDIKEVNNHATYDIGKYSSIDEYAGKAYMSYYYSQVSADGELYFQEDGIVAKNVSDASDDDGYWSSIVVDGLTMYISYFSITNYSMCSGKIVMAKSVNGGYYWENIEVDSGDFFWGEYFPDQNNEGFTSLAVDGDNLFISYCGEAGASPADPLRFAKSEEGGDAGSWVCTTIDNSIAKVGYYTSIAVNGTDGSNVYISYHDEGNGNLKFAKSADGGSTWE